MSIVPCRKEPSSTSEMVTQLLFGEHYVVKEISSGWVQIETAIDNYPCWISEKQHASITSAQFNFLNQNEVPVSAELVYILSDISNKRSFPVSIGCKLPFLSPNSPFQNAQFNYAFDGQVVAPGTKNGPQDLVSSAFLFLNAPYLWGGRGPFGIDCSGFTQLTYRLNGHLLPRDAWQQALLGEPLSFVEEALPGDLAFFDNAEGKITHVGMVIGDGQIIHASGSVRIDRFDHYGIHHTDKKQYTHNLRVIKRYL